MAPRPSGSPWSPGPPICPPGSQDPAQPPAPRHHRIYQWLTNFLLKRDGIWWRMHRCEIGGLFPARDPELPLRTLLRLFEG